MCRRKLKLTRKTQWRRYWPLPKGSVCLLCERAPFGCVAAAGPTCQPALLFPAALFGQLPTRSFAPGFPASGRCPEITPGSSGESWRRAQNTRYNSRRGAVLPKDSLIVLQSVPLFERKSMEMKVLPSLNIDIHKGFFCMV